MSQHKSKVLLVDDEPRLLSALRRRLSADFELITAEGGPKALEILQAEEDIAVVVADMSMPEMNGIELLKTVKAQWPAIRRVMLTGNADQDTAIAAINEGQVLRFLQKPCDTDELKSVLRQAIDEFEFQRADSHGADSAENLQKRAQIVRRGFLSFLTNLMQEPLGSLASLSGQLAGPQNLDGALPTEGDLEQIQAQSDELLTLVKKTRDYTQLLNERDQTQDTTFDLIALVKRVVEKHQHEAVMKSITISIDALRRYADVCAHENEVYLVVDELIENAIHYNFDGGHISIMIKCTQGRAAMRISNTGKSLPEETSHLIDQALHDEKNNDGAMFDGLGLGLALATTIAASNQAEFSVENHSSGVTATLEFLRPTLSSAMTGTG